MIAMLAGTATASAAHHHWRKRQPQAPRQETPAPAADSEDLSNAVPASSADHMPSSAAQYRTLQSEIAKSRPAVETAKQRSDVLNAQAAALRQQLITTAARVQDLEQQKIALDNDVSRLTTESAQLSASFAQQRVKVAALLAILERMQHDRPPVMAIRPGDALAGAHTAMLLGATLPRLYHAAAELARRLDAMKRMRAELVRRRAEAAQNSARLGTARGQLDQLLAMKSREADAANAQYGDLAARLDAVANEAQSLEVLLRKVAALRSAPTVQGVVVVAARNTQGQGLQRHSLLRPVVGRMEMGDGAPADAPHAPGISFLPPPGAQVIAPADSQVLFAGPYHKNGLVLILHGVGGYDLVLAGLERVDVRAGDQVLAGEPVGRMPHGGTEMRLYFEVRQNGKGASPAPWLAVEPRKVM
ncbi:MAG TPA: peptidoglycan DD-metalloendopeptidase family protein [Rhizomicrobium sp.]|jgi:septal ring factor EnvC (AmiA/AmiB activator)|nr:peptidoglycan DD-metalloendopeptidase family protein [Rhizomicrobium sp.]